MYSKLTSFLAIPAILLLLGASGIAQTPPQAPNTTAPSNPSAKATIRGRITDPSGALIPGTQVTISDHNGQTVATATADSAGNYEIHTLAPGTYTVMATFSGFAPFVSQNLVVTVGQAKRVDIAMAIETAQQSVIVTDETPTVSVEADSNANSLVIKGKDLEALSDDPDELSSELSALAGPSAGPNGGQIYIDGFTGGQLPPKSSIREIRVNQNPYSAEFDRLGFGRIEILTKPGTDKLHGQFLIQGNDDAFNTSSPFTKNIPPYYSYQYNGTLNGSLNKNTSFFVSAEHRSINNASVYTTPCDIDGFCPTLTPDGIVNYASNGAIISPRSRTNVSPRMDLQIGAKNTLTARYQFFHDSTSGNLGSTQLPTQANGTTTTDNSIQISDTQIINDHAVNETRFQYDHSIETTSPVNTEPTLQVQGIFSAGGNSQLNIHDHTDRWELQNITTMSAGKHAIKFGTRLRDTRDANFADSGFNGTFVFQTQTDYLNAVNSPTTANAQQLTYSTGTPNAVANVFDAALFVQDDWKFSPRLTLSGGLRWETQNHVSDHSDWAPRIAAAWAVDGKGGKQAKTVLRAGYGIFYDRLGINNFLTVNRSILQQQFTIDNPSSTCFANTINTSNIDASCGSGTAGSRTLYQVDPSYRSPYTQQFGASIERQITKTQTATVTYLHSFGVHQMVTINRNAPYFPDYQPLVGPVFQYFPQGVFKQDQLILNTNARFSRNFNVFGFYTLSFANSNGAGGNIASDSLNLDADYGPAGFVSRNQLFLIGNYSGPWGIRLNPFLIAQSGRPYNITVTDDVNGDRVLNNRPGLVASSLCTPNSTQYKQTSFGCLDTTPPVSGEPIIGFNAGNGPAAVAVNLRLSKSFGIGPKLQTEAANTNQGGGPPGGGPPGGGGGRGGGPGGGGPGGGFGPGGFGGGGGGRGGPGGAFAQQGTGRRFNLNMSVQALNLFNNINYGTPIGTATAPGNLDGQTDQFGRSTSLQGGIFSQGSAPRRIFLQAVFSF